MMKRFIAYLIVFSLSCMVSTFGFGGWHVETIDSARMHSGELSFDDTGQLQFLSKVDGLDDLVHHVYGSGGWNATCLNAPDSEGTPFLQADGTVWLFCYNSKTQSLICWKKQGDEWQQELVIESEWSCQVHRVKMDETSRIHIVYQAMDRYWYGIRDNSGWHVERISDEQSEYSFVTLTLDNQNYPHVMYGEGNDSFKYMYMTGGGWQTEQVDIESGRVQRPYLFLDNDDDPHFYYNYNYPEAFLQVVYREGDQWFHDQILPGWDACYAQGPGGEIRAMYLVDGPDEIWLKYAVQLGETWQTNIIKNYDQTSNPEQLVIDENDHAHILETFYLEGILNYMYQVDDAFQSELITSYGATGKVSSLGIGPDQCLKVCYFDQTHESLKYAYKDEYGWHTQWIDEATKVSPYISMQVDTLSRTQVAYQDNETLDLKLAVQSGDDWVITPVVTDGETGYAPSLVVDASNNPGIAFYDQTRFDLRYAVNVGSGWQVETVHENLSNITEPSLVLDRSGRSHVSFCDSVNETLWFAQHSDDGWTVENVAHVSMGNVNNSLCFDDNNTPHILYSNADTNQLRHAYKVNDQWTVETVTDSVVDSVTAQCDSTGCLNVVIRTVKDIIYCRKDQAGVWHNVTLGRDVYDGDVSLVVGADDMLHLTCYNRISNLSYAVTQDLYATIRMPDNTFRAGDICGMDVTVTHSGAWGYDDFALFVLLEVNNQYFFAPSFDNYDYFPMSMPLMLTEKNITVVPEFIWPDGVGLASGIRWLVAATDSDVTSLISNCAVWTFGWE